MPDKGNLLGRRKLLTRATAALAAVGAGLMATPFVASWFPSRKAQAVGAPIKVNLSSIKNGQMITVVWQQKPIFILRRKKTIVNLLNEPTVALADPESLASKQPYYAQNAQRSLRPDIGVYIASCTHLGCIPLYKPEDASFFCPCHGSKFDLAGRVLASMPAPSNLAVPPHYFVNDNLLVVGENATGGSA